MDLLMYCPDILNLTEIVRNRLYFAVVTQDIRLKNSTDTLFFNTDNEFIYLNYYYDFGPLNLSCLYKFCCKINEFLQSTKFKRIVYYTSSDHNTKANSAFLIGCFAVLYLKVHPREITRALVSGCVHFVPFADASQGGSDWTITLIDCFNAIHKSSNLRFFDFEDFDIGEYDSYDKLVNGDLNWLVPKKFLAFIGPTDLEIINFHSPDFYIQYFMKNNVQAVIRLNNNTYNSTVFTSVGIEHYDLYFPDGSTPPKKILLDFLEIVERTPGAIAVHCKAGLGRTGSLIGAYIVKHFRFTAKEAIAWLRICRPGSVIGQQQGWLERMENWLWRQGNYYRYEVLGDCNRILKNTHGIYSIEWKKERSEKERLAKQQELENSMLESNKKARQSCKDSNKMPPNRQHTSKERQIKNVPNKILYETNFDNVQRSSNSTQGDKLNLIKMKKTARSSIDYAFRKNDIDYATKRKF